MITWVQPTAKNFDRRSKTEVIKKEKTKKKKNKESDMFLEFRVVNSIVCKHRTQKISAFELNGSRIKSFGKPE